MIIVLVDGVGNVRGLELNKDPDPIIWPAKVFEFDRTWELDYKENIKEHPVYRLQGYSGVEIRFNRSK